MTLVACALFAGASLGAAQEPAEFRYIPDQWRCVSLHERSRAVLEAQTGLRRRRETLTRDGLWRLRGLPVPAGISVEAWYDSLTVSRTSPYALTGAVFSRDRAALLEADRALRQAAGNFYVNDKPTGAVVGQQPFGGARASGTNDKAGSILNLLRWVSPRSIKETLVPPKDYRYPFMAEA